jgi:thymidylate synthase
MQVQYLPFEERSPDTQYRKLISRILFTGSQVMPQQEESAVMVLGHQMRFQFANGFPILTERDLVTPLASGGNSIFHQSLGELFCFLAGGHTLDSLREYDCSWWDRWATREKCSKRGLPAGDLGPGSYGPAWTNFPTIDGTGHDQIAAIIQQIKELPHLRTHFISPWIPQYIVRGKGKKQQVVVVPCHGWVHILVYPNSRELSLHHFQRSGDVPVGVACNILQYAALTLMIAQVTGYKPRELVYTISDAHIYAQQIPKVNQLLQRAPRRFPTVTLDSSVTDIRDFRQHHFRVEDYNPHPKMFIGTPI